MLEVTEPVENKAEWHKPELETCQLEQTLSSGGSGTDGSLEATS